MLTAIDKRRMDRRNIGNSYTDIRAEQKEIRSLIGLLGDIALSPQEQLQLNSTDPGVDVGRTRLRQGLSKTRKRLAREADIRGLSYDNNPYPTADELDGASAGDPAKIAPDLDGFPPEGGGDGAGPGALLAGLALAALIWLLTRPR